MSTPLCRYTRPANMKALDFKGKLVVVTGASSGLGREIARELALREGAHVAVAARRRDRLEQLKAEIEARCASRVHLIPVDLGAPEGAQILFHEATARGDVHALVNCAGITFLGRTLEAPMATSDQIVAVNLVAEMRTSILFLRYFLERGEGALLNVTSVSAFFTLPYQNVYAATKHAMQAFTEGLAYEYRGKGVSICSFAPSGIATEMITNAGMDKKLLPGMKAFLMSPEKVARLAIRSLKKGRIVAVPGLSNRAGLFLTRFLPRRAVSAAVGSAYKL